MSNSSPPSVTVVGGGMAGLTAAYYLARNGCQVTLYEATDRVGGALSAVSYPINGPTGDAVNFECSPHMFGDWYNNFFSLMQEIGVPKDKFEQAQSIHFLGRAGEGGHSGYTTLRNNGSIADGAGICFPALTRHGTCSCIGTPLSTF